MNNEAKDPIDEFEDAVQDLWTGGDLDSTSARVKLARAELTRRSELAAKYERLTRALAGMFSQCNDLMCDGVYGLQLCDERGCHTIVAKDELTPDSIATAIIAAAEGAK